MIGLRSLFLLMSGLAITTCSSQRERTPVTGDTTAMRTPTGNINVDSAQLPATRFPPMLWGHYGTHEPSFCLHLDSASSGRFVGGFLFLNPLQWSFDTVRYRLSLTLPAMDSTYEPSLLYEAAARGIVGYDANTRTVTFALDPRAPSLVFMGNLLTPPDSLADWEYENVRTGCPELMPHRSLR